MPWELIGTVLVFGGLFCAGILLHLREVGHELDEILGKADRRALAQVDMDGER
jgi:hypothetical protein